MGPQAMLDKVNFYLKSKLSKPIQCCYNNHGIVQLFFKKFVRKNNI